MGSCKISGNIFNKYFKYRRGKGDLNNCMALLQSKKPKPTHLLEEDQEEKDLYLLDDHRTARTPQQEMLQR